METFGGLAGASLGYLYSRNLEGAYHGYNIGRAMAIYSRKRKSTFSGYSRNSRYKKVRTSQPMRLRGGRTKRDNFVTQQHDYTVQYRKKSMPKRRKKQWRKFVKRVQAVQLKDSGLRTVIFNQRMTNTNSATYQGLFDIGLYGNVGAEDSSYWSGWNDLHRIFKNDPDIVVAPYPPLTTTQPRNGKLLFNSAVLDVTIRNLDNNIPAEVDVYTYYFRKNTQLYSIDSTIGLQQLTPSQAFASGAVDSVINFPSNSRINLDQRGVTLFDMSQALSRTGIKIVKKMKYMIEPGRSVFYQHRDSKNHLLEAQNLNQIGYAVKGLTLGLMIVFKPAVTAVDTTTIQLGVGVTRKYSYTPLLNNKDASGTLLPLAPV